MRTPKIPEIKKDEFSPIVIELLDVLRYQAEQIQILRNEIAVLKGDKRPPKIKPGNLTTLVQDMMEKMVTVLK